MDPFELSEGIAALTAHAETWDMLAAQRSNPFLTHAWLSQWAKTHEARRRLWDELARIGPRRFHLSGLYVGSRETEIACQALADARYGVLPSVPEFPSPYITRPASFEELRASRSRSTRKQAAQSSTRA